MASQKRAPDPIAAKASAPSQRYGACKRNHALGNGGYLLDGCQEFDTDCETSKICSACGCHRSFHTKIGDNPGSTGAGFSEGLLDPPASPGDSRENGGAAADTRNSSTSSKGRKPCRSKQLRAKACQIWTDYLRPLSAAQGLHGRFCDTKESCVAEMQRGGHPLCISKCSQLKWPPHVPFAHPKDMASRELQAFINTYEGDWQEHCLRNHGFSSACALLPRLKKGKL
ncbi:uncharacterized protein LOC9652532 [Selaginella moellendorffii]|nr:uncharacterized protein LOC9652532 [Selaginella moellendorffii]|eukprot:XP_002966706.2 uncharacterized protein LOC9652532 [Selaginella moellendorffii]